MRPGPIRPGDPEGGTGDSGVSRQASMRPGPIRPGDGITGMPPGSLAPRFNEARADSPGRYIPDGRGVEHLYLASMRPGPIRPGDLAWTEEHHDHIRSASMRPGPIRPGDRDRSTVVPASAPASMRPGPIRPGDAIRPGAASVKGAPASMRPGPIRPGDDILERRAPEVESASMRPGPIRPGDLKAARIGYTEGIIGFNEARADSPGRLRAMCFRAPGVLWLQ